MLRKNRAFTLIELLVVISIIAILASILFPVFAQAKLAAKKTVDLSDIKQLGTAVVLYTNDYDDAYPMATNFNAAMDSGANYGYMQRWSSTLVTGPYIKNTDIFLAPVDRYVPDVTTHPTELPLPLTRIAKPISYLTNSLTTAILTGNGGPTPAIPGQGGSQCAYFPSTPYPVPTCDGPINPGGWYTNAPSSINTTSGDSPSDLIIFAEGSPELANWYNCPNTVNTETFYCDGSDSLVYGYDALSMALGSYLGQPDPNYAKAWRAYANQSNFAFSDTHAKSMPPGKLTIGVLLNPRYWCVNIPTGY